MADSLTETFASAMTRADGDPCDTERAEFYLQHLRALGLVVVPETELALATDALSRIVAGSGAEGRPGQRGYITRSGLHGIARTALDKIRAAR
jgi:hypothetical protein